MGGERKIVYLEKRKWMLRGGRMHVISSVSGSRGRNRSIRSPRRKG